MSESHGGDVTMLIESKTFYSVKHGLDQLWLAVWLVDDLPKMHTRMSGIAEIAEWALFGECDKQVRQIATEVRSDD